MSYIVKAGAYQITYDSLREAAVDASFWCDRGKNAEIVSAGPTVADVLRVLKARRDDAASELRYMAFEEAIALVRQLT
jgi:hypothetical protein